MEREKALAKGMLPPTIKGSGAVGIQAAIGRNPKLVSTLRRPYLPGVGRKTSSIGLNHGVFVPGRGKGRGRGLFIPGLRGRGFIVFNSED